MNWLRVAEEWVFGILAELFVAKEKSAEFFKCFTFVYWWQLQFAIGTFNTPDEMFYHLLGIHLSPFAFGIGIKLPEQFRKIVEEEEVFVGRLPCSDCCVGGIFARS